MCREFEQAMESVNTKAQRSVRGLSVNAFHLNILVLVMLLMMTTRAIGEQSDSSLSLLQQSPSPYLQSHANDPVDWRLLQADTLQQATEAMRPLFITSGYHACYWCHRLKQDTLSNRLLADTLNRSFIPVLIDREMHPAEDDYLQVFMRTVMGTPGWPIMVILTPEGDPLFGYTYTDTATLHGSLKIFLRQWNQSAQKIMADARRSRSTVADRQHEDRKPLTGSTTQGFVKAFLQQTNSVADIQYGGFGNEEKYPWFPQLLALVDLMAINAQPEVIQFISDTVDRMLLSGLVYQVDGSVFRYTTTADWRAPHFEQMLYTQALMIKLLARTDQLTGQQKFGKAAVRTAKTMVDSFRMPNGWYRSARSAVSDDQQDGGYYLWSRAELETLLGENWTELVTDIGNGADSVLPFFHQSSAIDILAREQRKRTAVTDDKALTGWNGLALSGLASAVASDDSLLAPTQALAEQLLALATAGPLPFLAGQTTNMKAADLPALVYTAGGFIDWWQLSADDRFSEAAGNLLVNAYDRFFDQGLWRQSRLNLLGPVSESVAIADNQLPSASGEWIRLAQLLILANPQKHAKLVAMVTRIKQTSPSQAMQEQAFFHGTTIAALVVSELLKRTNPSS